MNLRTIGQLLKDDKLTIDLCGHASRQIKERFLYSYEDLLEGEAGKNDGKWGDPSKDAQMREHYKGNLDWDFDARAKRLGIVGIGSDWRYYCFGCGEQLGLVIDGDRLCLRYYFNGKDFDVHPKDYRCPYENPKPFRCKINIASKMVFANFFKSVQDTPEEYEYHDDWSINCLAGRERVMHHKAKSNVAYGQMGNMSVGVFVNKDKDSIIIGDPWTEEGNRKVISGHKIAGTICLDVWRWEASDMNTVAKDVEQLEAKDYDVVKVNAKHGVWKVEQSFHCGENGGENSRKIIYARLKLVK